MAYNMTTAGNDRVEYGDVAAFAGLTALTVAFTVKLNAAPSNRRYLGQWGATTGEWAWLCQAIDTDEIGFVVFNSGLYRFYGPKTTGTNFASGSTYRIVMRVYGLDTTQASDIWVNGSTATTTDWFSNTCPSVADASSTFYVGYEASSASACEEGDYSEVAIWGAKLPDADCVAYGNGFSPELLSRTSRILYAPMIRGLNDKWGGKTGTATGGSVAAHPRVIYPRRKQVVVPSAAAATTFGFLRDNAGLGVMGGGPFSRANAGLGVLA